MGHAQPEVRHLRRGPLPVAGGHRQHRRRHRGARAEDEPDARCAAHRPPRARRRWPSTTVTPSRSTMRAATRSPSATAPTSWCSTIFTIRVSTQWTGKHFSMEMHLVHKAESGKLAVIGVFIEQGGSQRGVRSNLEQPAEAEGRGDALPVGERGRGQAPPRQPRLVPLQRLADHASRAPRVCAGSS